MPDKTCVMTTRPTFGREYFTCSECGRRDGDADWKFCAGCGSEIVRYIREEGPQTVQLSVTTVEQESTVLNLRIDKESKKAKTKKV